MKTWKEIKNWVDENEQWYREYNRREDYIVANVKNYNFPSLKKVHAYFDRAHPFIADQLKGLWTEETLWKEWYFFLESESDYLDDWLNGCAYDPEEPERQYLDLLASMLGQERRTWKGIDGKEYISYYCDKFYRFGRSGGWQGLARTDCLDSLFNDLQYNIDCADGRNRELKTQSLELIQEAEKFFEALDWTIEKVERMAQGLDFQDWLENEGSSLLMDQVDQLNSRVKAKAAIGIA